MKNDSEVLESWGRNPQIQQSSTSLHWRSDIHFSSEKKMLPYGMGRSYGDVCLHEGGLLLKTRGLNRFLEFDAEEGRLICEAGVSFEEILDFAVPRGWFLPVTPGTKYVTVGGAIANDVHGKNHHRAGSFGCHVVRFELLRSDGTHLLCSQTENTDWFRATVGGLGLTGVITWADIRLKKVVSPFIRQETVPFRCVDDFFALSASSNRDFEYTVAWIDCLAKGKNLGRGIFIRGNHAEMNSTKKNPKRKKPTWSIPCQMPSFLLNPLTIKVFNGMYYFSQCWRKDSRLVHFDPFFYPLDAVKCWNRLYGHRGFFQYQCVVPPQTAPENIRRLLDKVSHSKQASFLSVLKQFGSLPSPGMMSFPRKGVTLAMDFPNRGIKTSQLLHQLDDIVQKVGGAVYPAKDACMSRTSFAAYYPRWKEFASYIDPQFSSSFWKRVKGE
ncbi:MAG: FAD-linked oxidase [Deltaproteobacteria bacterium RIFCSPLOWO2_02_FULL_44_10]|nr:MAG: FAD-linked oxidase [Deltaproteobacteria bacterium RIFCSPHIGHO2_02_FULL_44_16]OGQ45974.1 MAG: FAD-linked oxidase [Deltaproteobacteria bacterium RIFCSPLOWO2_02_FULL_44_10]